MTWVRSVGRNGVSRSGVGLGLDGWFWWDRRLGKGLKKVIGTKGSRTSWKRKRIVHQCHVFCILRSSRGFGRASDHEESIGGSHCVIGKIG